MTDTKERLHAVLRHALDLDHSFEILDEHDIINDLGADSLNIIEIIMEVENEFDIEVADTEIEGVQEVWHIAKLIEHLS